MPVAALRRCHTESAWGNRSAKGRAANVLPVIREIRAIGAERTIAMSRHKTRQDLALEFGATDVISERGMEALSGSTS